MGKNKALVRVKVFKTFDYPKAMLHKDLFIQDALNKARNDMQNFVDEVMQNDHAQLGHDMFNYEAIEEVGYKFRNRQLDESDCSKVSIAKSAKILTTLRMEAEHGPLNPEVNPQLYEHEPEVRSKDGADVVREEQWYMKEKIQDQFYQVYDEYLHLLRNIK